MKLDKARAPTMDELHKDAFITDATYAGLAARYTTRQLMDLVFAIGQYTLVSMVLNTFGVQLDADLDTSFAET